MARYRLDQSKTEAYLTYMHTPFAQRGTQQAFNLSNYQTGKRPTGARASTASKPHSVGSATQLRRAKHANHRITLFTSNTCARHDRRQSGWGRDSDTRTSSSWTRWTPRKERLHQHRTQPRAPPPSPSIPKTSASLVPGALRVVEN
jgi:hypothetical protein